MPGLNGTGPQGQGSRTGGKFGRCQSSSEESSAQDQMGGVGRGGQPRGGGRGRTFGGKRGKGRQRHIGQDQLPSEVSTPLTRNEELAQLQHQLDSIQTRINQLTIQE